MKKPEFTPITTLPTLENWEENNSLGNLTWDFSLPPSLDAERLAVRTSRIDHIIAMGGFRSLHILGYEGESTRYTPEVNGISGIGTATASKRGTYSPEPRSDEELVDDIDVPLLMRSYFKTTGILGLNKTEIVSRVADRVVADREKQTDTREKAWAAELDSALSISVRNAADRHLRQREGKTAATVDSLIFAVLAGWAALGIRSGDYTPLSSIVEGFGVISSIRLTTDSLFNKGTFGSSLLSERRWTMSPLPTRQPDRYLAVSALTRVAPLIEYRK